MVIVCMSDITQKLPLIITLFQPPFLCPTQIASYTLTFTTDGTDDDNDGSWSTESKVLTATHEVVVDEIESERFQLEKNYTVTVTIMTALGNVSSSAAMFSKW